MYVVYLSPSPPPIILKLVLAGGLKRIWQNYISLKWTTDLIHYPFNFTF